MNDLFKDEINYCRNFDSQFSYLEKLYNKIKSVHFSLKNRDITKAILWRMRTYSLHQEKLKKLLNKRYATAAADFFVETTTFYLKAYYNSYSGYEVCSERQVKREKGAKRPDITIWKEEKLVACIECKTQLGWNRLNWENDFLGKKEQISKDNPDAKIFLLVLTESNWAGFSSIIGNREEYFLLSKKRPIDITVSNIEENIIDPIEKLISRIKKT